MTFLPLGEVIELAYGKSLPARARRGGSVPVYGSNGVVGWHDRALIREPTVIVGRKGSVGAIHLISAPSFPIDTTYFVRPRPGIQLDMTYASYALKFVDLSRLRTETGVPGLNRTDAYRELIPLPPLDEQRRIVGILNRATKIEQLRAQAQERLQEFISALFVKMFGDPATNPMGWEIRKLKELCEIDRQNLAPETATISPLPFVGVENVEANTGVISFGSTSRCGSQKSSVFQFDEHHVLYGKLRPYLNKVAVPDFAGKCSTELIPILPRKHVERQFIAHLLRHKETVNYVMMSVTGSRMPRTDMKMLMSMPVPLPPLSLQRCFATTVNQAECAAGDGRRVTNITSELSTSFMLRLLEASA